MSYGIVIARFQVATLTDGHRSILDYAQALHFGNLLVLLGDCEKKPSKRYPLPYYVRAQMVQAAYPHALVVPIMDVSSDHTWSESVDRIIGTTIPGQRVTIYGGRDSFIDQYHGQLKTEYVAITCPVSGTRHREYWRDTTVNSEEFRAGMLHAAAMFENLLGSN